LGAGGEREQTRRVLGEQRVIHTRLVIETFEEREGGEPHQVPEALLVAREQHEMVGGVARPLAAVAAGDVGLHPHDRLDVGPARPAATTVKRCVPGAGGTRGRQRSVFSSASHSDGTRAPSTSNALARGSTPLHASVSTASSCQRLYGPAAAARALGVRATMRG